MVLTEVDSEVCLWCDNTRDEVMKTNGDEVEVWWNDTTLDEKDDAIMDIGEVPVLPNDTAKEVEVTADDSNVGIRYMYVDEEAVVTTDNVELTL